MEERTADEIAKIFSAAGDSVTVIGTAQGSDETDDEFVDFEDDKTVENKNEEKSSEDDTDEDDSDDSDDSDSDSD